MFSPLGHIPRVRGVCAYQLVGCKCGGALVTFLVVISTIYCHGIDTDELDFTRGQPVRADVIGKWIPVTSPNQSALSPISEQEIDLRADGSFSAVNLPTSPDVPGASTKGLLSGSGEWRLNKDRDGFTIWIINLDFASHHRETVHLRRQKPPYLIHIFVGDPDSGQAALFHRVP